MSRFIEGCDRREQLGFLPRCMDDTVAEDSAVRIVDVVVDALDQATPPGLQTPPGNYVFHPISGQDGDGAALAM